MCVFPHCQSLSFGQKGLSNNLTSIVSLYNTTVKTVMLNYLCCVVLCKEKGRKRARVLRPSLSITYQTSVPSRPPRLARIHRLDSWPSPSSWKYSRKIYSPLRHSSLEGLALLPVIPHQPSLAWKKKVPVGIFPWAFSVTLRVRPVWSS